MSIRAWHFAIVVEPILTLSNAPLGPRLRSTMAEITRTWGARRGSRPNMAFLLRGVAMDR
jgi:hypothetical protein